MELPIKTVVILVVLLVLVLVVLILVSRTAYDFSDVGEDKIDVAGSVTNCEILCWECCRGVENKCDFNTGANCGCDLNYVGCD